MPIRLKLALALVVPLAAVLVLTGLEYRQARATTADVREQAALAQGVSGPGSLVRSLRDEQIDALTTTVGLRSSAPLKTEDLAETQAQVDVARRDLRARLESGELPGADRYLPALDEVDQGLVEVRAHVAAVPDEASLELVERGGDLYAEYEPLMGALEDAADRIVTRIDRPELREPVLLLNVIARSKGDYAGLVQAALIGEVTGGVARGPNRDAVIDARARVDDVRQQFALLAGEGPVGEIASGLYDSPEQAKLRGLIDAQLDGGAMDIVGTVEAAAAADRRSNDPSIAALAEELDGRSRALLDDAEQRERGFLLVALAVVLVGLVGSVVAAESIARPLRQATNQADAVAGKRLPYVFRKATETPLHRPLAIPELPKLHVRSRDEVQALVGALNRVQGIASGLAIEQAQGARDLAGSFGSLAGRAQELLGRQLAVLDGLERAERDPGALEQLFLVDHLTARLRRVVESQLALAGPDLGRTSVDPVVVSDVFLATLGEVEDPGRATVVVVDEVAILGAHAAALVHLLAELLDNALVATPDGQLVDLIGRTGPQGYSVAVVDRGPGLGEAARELLNDRLGRAEGRIPGPAGGLGIDLAARLGGRLGVSVSLEPGAQGGGIVACVELPAAILAPASGDVEADVDVEVAVEAEAEVDGVAEGVGARDQVEPPLAPAVDPARAAVVTADPERPERLGEPVGAGGRDGGELADASPPGGGGGDRRQPVLAAVDDGAAWAAWMAADPDAGTRRRRS